MMSNLMLLHGENLELLNGIMIKCPKVYDVLELEKLKILNKSKFPEESFGDYNDYVQILTSTSLDVADILWFDMQIWYEDIKSEWNFFVQKSILNKKMIDVFLEVEIGEKKLNIKKQAVTIDKLYRDSLNYFLGLSGEYVLLDITSENKDTQVVMCNVQKNELNEYIIDDNNIRFTEVLYYSLLDYLKKINWMIKKYMFLDGGAKYAKRYILKEEYKQRNKKNNNEKYYVSFDSIISSLIAKGINYNDIWNFPVYLVYDLYYRNIKIDDWKNTMDALHNGCIDTTKNPINWDQLNWGSVINLN